ncbi:hypothetical protein HanPI659440_Chr10g0376361 [Helianthus annuus]|nr:hypothetical protein HanPI659440_Chr10g0376361 [Helianthus annuus]
MFGFLKVTTFHSKEATKVTFYIKQGVCMCGFLKVTTFHSREREVEDVFLGFSNDN